VLALLVFDFVDNLDFSSKSRLTRLCCEVLELGLDSVFKCSWDLVVLLGVSFCCWENSVSGGLGGRLSLEVVAAFGVTFSADFDFKFSSKPTSVDCGV